MNLLAVSNEEFPIPSEKPTSLAPVGQHINVFFENVASPFVCPNFVLGVSGETLEL